MPAAANAARCRESALKCATPERFYHFNTFPPSAFGRVLSVQPSGGRKCQFQGRTLDGRAGNNCPPVSAAMILPRQYIVLIGYFHNWHRDCYVLGVELSQEVTNYVFGH